MYYYSHQDDIEEDIGDETRLADDLLGGAEAKGSSGAGGAEPQSKLVKDIMSRQVEQEAPRVNKIEVIADHALVSFVLMIFIPVHTIHATCILYLCIG